MPGAAAGVYVARLAGTYGIVDADHEQIRSEVRGVPHVLEAIEQPRGAGPSCYGAAENAANVRVRGVR
jgi:hypothetical protein